MADGEKKVKVTVVCSGNSIIDGHHFTAKGSFAEIFNEIVSMKVMGMPVFQLRVGKDTASTGAVFILKSQMVAMQVNPA